MALTPFQPPLIVHHMGALDNSGALPNSLEAIRASLDAGADYIEIDANALAEADFLVMHGPDMTDETTSTGVPADYTVERAREVAFKPLNGKIARVPLLGEVVALFGDYPTQTQLQIDFKNVLPMQDDEPLHRLVRLTEPLGNRVIVSTGADWQLRGLRRVAPDLQLGFDIQFYIDWRSPDYVPNPDPTRNPPPFRKGVYGYWDDHFLAGFPLWSVDRYLDDRLEAIAAQVPGVEIAYLSYRFILQALSDGSNPVDALHRAGVRCDAWTLDIKSQESIDALRRLLDAGVDQFTSNTPLALRRALDAL